MAKVTHDHADLLLRLYEMRREPRMRQARDWYVSKFHPTSMEDVQKQAPMGSPESAYFRQVVSYWDMAASIVNRGLIDEAFFFENTGEQWLVFERIKPFVAAMRARGKNPHMYGNLEKHVKKLEAWRNKRAPGSVEAMRQMMTQMMPPPAKS
jgi:hypothetical protein